MKDKNHSPIPPDSPDSLNPNITSDQTEIFQTTKTVIDQIEEIVTNEKISTSFVSVLRTITAHNLRKDEEFSYFIPDGQTLDKVIETALTMGEDAEQLQMMGLLKWFQIGCHVSQLDRTNNVSYQLPDESLPTRICLLYRPGHYDLLYKRNYN